MGKFLFNIVLVFSALFTPLFVSPLPFFFRWKQMTSLFIQFLFVFVEEGSYLFYSLSCCLHLMIFVLSMYCAFGANWFVARKAKVSEFFLVVIRARILNLISTFFWVGCVRRLRDRLWSIILRVVRGFFILGGLIFSRILDGLIRPSSWGTQLYLIVIFAGMRIIWIDCFVGLWFTPSFQLIINSLQLNNTWSI